MHIIIPLTKVTHWIICDFPPLGYLTFALLFENVNKVH